MRHPIVRTCLSLVLGLVPWLSPVLAAHAAETDLANIPMAVSNNAPPNFMFMVDNSGSMSNIVPDAPYSSGAASSLGAACTAANQKIPATDAVYLRVVSGVPKVQLDASLGSGGSRTSCTAGCTVGTGSGEVCFDDTATYTNVRLMSTLGCGSGCTTASGATYLPASYSGHYLNWYFRSGTLTGWTDRKPGAKSRLEIAKTATKAALDSIPLPTGGNSAKVRAGLVTYNGDDGGLLLRGLQDLDATHLANLKTSVDNLSATGSTPLSETLADIGQYFSLGNTGNLIAHPGTASAASVTPAQLFQQGAATPHRLNQGPVSCAGFTCPVQYWCQRSYAILMTDGRPQNDQALSSNSTLCDYDGDSGTCSTNGGRAYDQKNGASSTNHTGHLGGPHSYESAGSDYLNDVAQALREIDLRPDLTAPGGRAKANTVRTYTVGFADQQAQDDPLLQETAAQGGGLFLKADNVDSLTKAFTNALGDAMDRDSAAAAVAVTSSQITSNNTSYMSSYTSGYWTGDLEAFSLDLASGLPIIPRLWSAQAKLDALATPQSSRKIVSLSGGNGSAFSGSYSDDSIGLTAGVIDYLRGNRSGEGTTYRRRQHLLGDIINSEPVVVSYGSSVVVFQGANDGMLHAFDGSTGSAGGTELWAYVPRMLLPRLSRLADPAYSHEYFVDATPAVADVSNPGFTEKILVGGLGKGGRGYYALKITSGTAASESDAANKVLWETVPSAANGGYSFGTPLIVKTPNDGWLVLVTSGYNNGSTTGGDGKGHLWALDPRDGRVVHEMVTSEGSAAIPAGLTHLSRLSNAAADATTRYVYGGDLLGNVWRFDLANWSTPPLKIATLADGNGAAQPITSAPVVRQVAGSTDKFWVDVGTGQYLGNSDVPNDPSENVHATQTQSMYGIIDDTTLTPAPPNIRGSNGNSCPADGGTGDFICQRVVGSTSTSYTLSTNLLQSGHRGWYFDLPVANGRINTHPAVTTTGVLVFTVNVPSSVICDPGGSNWFFAVDADSGGAVRRSITGGATYESGWLQGYGIASRVVIIETSTGKRALIRTSNREDPHPPIPETLGSVPSKWRRVYWRELM